MASMLMPNDSCSGVIFQRLFRTTSGDGVLLEVDDDAHAVAVGLVADVGDALDALLAHQLGDLLDQLGLVDLVGDLGGDDRLAPGLGVLLDRGAGAHQHARRGPSRRPGGCRRDRR